MANSFHLARTPKVRLAHHKRPPSRAARGPFHLLRLHLDLCSNVLKRVTVTFPSEKCFSTFQRSLAACSLSSSPFDKLHTGDHFGDEFGSIQSAPVLLGLGTELEDHG
jgi:hypothetical protein